MLGIQPQAGAAHRDASAASALLLIVKGLAPPLHSTLSSIDTCTGRPSLATLPQIAHFS